MDVSFWIYRVKNLMKCNEKSNRNSDAANGISFGPIFDKFTLKIRGKKGSIAAIEYQLLVAATNNFDVSNIQGKGGLGHAYKTYFNDHFHAAVKDIYAGGQEAERKFQSNLWDIPFGQLLNYLKDGAVCFLNGCTCQTVVLPEGMKDVSGCVCSISISSH
ncbi:hypothetical protein DH2020_042659 [Rehmannia glutinosa]|uniref:Uncharacterized protein n=1 Tax=Rehmannia glutinosa TaxID=99300 RepID=A0ABR0UMG3_REHGL